MAADFNLNLKFDPLITLFYILIAILITIVIGFIAKLSLTQHPWTFALIVAGTYILIQLIAMQVAQQNLTTQTTANAALMTQPLAKLTPLPSGVYVQPGTFDKDSVQIMDGTEVPIMGPLDALSPDDVNKRLDYLYRKTAYPYRPLTYFDFETPSDKILINSKQNLLRRADLSGFRQEMERWYPLTTKNQISARDCTNYPAGHPGSCIIAPEPIIEVKEGFDSEPKPVVDLDKRVKNSNRRAPYGGDLSYNGGSVRPSIPSMLLRKSQLGDLAVLFKNAPSFLPQRVDNTKQIMSIDVDNTEIKPDSAALISRGGVYGRCRSDYCGSRVLEPGNDNIIDPANMLLSYF